MESDRKTFIGGSDIAGIMGVSRWTTPLQIWAEKTGQVEPRDLSDNEAVQLGIELEDFCAKKFERVTGQKVRKAPQRYVHKQYPFFACQVDRLVTGTDELLECKTASAWKEKEWEGDEIPIEYVLQVQWQLFLTGREYGNICVLIGGQKFRYKRIRADESLFKSMEEAALKFWEMVQSKTPPVVEAMDNAFLIELYPSASPAMIEATQDVDNAVAMLMQTKGQIDELIQTKNEIEAKIKAVIGNNLGIKTPKYTVKWLNVKGSTYTVTKPDSRMLRVTKNKGGE